MADHADIETMSFEDALAELEAIVRRLEAGQGNLDESIQAYERGAKLKEHCERRLREATMRIEAIARGAGGEVVAGPSNLGDTSAD